jgi:multidrug resistance efflux pump
MRRFGRFLLCFALGAGLILAGTLSAAPQKVARQKPKSVVKIDKKDYKQKVVQLRGNIRQDRQKLKADRQQFGKGNDVIKADRQQLRKDTKALTRLVRTRKQGRLVIRKKLV